MSILMESLQNTTSRRRHKARPPSESRRVAAQEGPEQNKHLTWCWNWTEMFCLYLLFVIVLFNILHFFKFNLFCCIKTDKLHFMHCWDNFYSCVLSLQTYSFSPSCNIISLWKHCCTASSFCFLFAHWSGNKICSPPKNWLAKKKAALFATHTKLPRRYSDFDFVLCHCKTPIEHNPLALFWLEPQAVTSWLSLDSSVKMNN